MEEPTKIKIKQMNVRVGKSTNNPAFRNGMAVHLVN
jgi:hypothetical protein